MEWTRCRVKRWVCPFNKRKTEQAALKLAVYMAKLQDLTLTYEKSTTAVLDYLSKHEAAVQSLQNIHSGENANDFRHHQLDQLHELHNMVSLSFHGEILLQSHVTPAVRIFACPKIVSDKARYI